jgi:hypothetical protein
MESTRRIAFELETGSIRSISALADKNQDDYLRFLEELTQLFAIHSQRWREQDVHDESIHRRLVDRNMIAASNDVAMPPPVRFVRRQMARPASRRTCMQIG